MDKAWKQRERKIAADFGCERNALSGGNSKLSRSDSTSDVLFIEAKGRARHATIGLFDETKALAKKEGKTPVLALWQPRRHNYLVVCAPEDLPLIAEQYRGGTLCQEEAQAGSNTPPQ